MPDGRDHSAFSPQISTRAAAANDGHHMARGAMANGLVLLASNFRALFTFLIARLLGEAALGRFGLAFASTELLSKIGMLGFDNAIIPFVAPLARSGNRFGAARMLRTTTLVAGLVSTAVTIVAFMLVWRIPALRDLYGLSQGGVVMLLALPGIAIARIATGASRAVLAMKSEFYSRGLAETWVTTGAFVVAMALGIRDTAPALAVAVGSTAAALVAYVLAARALAARIDPASGDSTHEGHAIGPATCRPVGSLLRFSLPIAASSLLTALVMRVDVLLLGAYINRAPGVTLESFGVFCAAAEIAGGLRKVRQVFDPIFAPIVATRALSTERDALRATVSGPGRWVLAAQLPLVGVLALSGGTVMSLYGPGFRSGALWLALLGVAHGTNAFAGLVETMLMMERPSLNLLNAGVTVAVQAIAGVMLIPTWGVTGAAMAMCLGFAVQGVLRFVEVKHVFGWTWPWQSLVRPLVAGTLAIGPAAALRVFVSGWWVEPTAGLLSVALYVLAWMGLGADPDDREVYRRLFDRSSSSTPSRWSGA
ncbi:MAG: oligosaccharide flippase family protein [Vicinamibacterales bacterium]